MQTQVGTTYFFFEFISLMICFIMADHNKQSSTAMPLIASKK